MEFVILAIPYMRRLGERVGRAGSDPNRFQALMANLRRRNRRAFEENWRLVKALWTQEVVSISGEFWQAPPAMDWTFAPTSEWSPGSVTTDGTLKEIGIVPRPLQNDPHPPVYAPFSYSMGTAKFWAREGGKMMGMFNETFGIDEFFLWHHVGWFEQDEEMAMLHEFAEGVIGPLSS